MSPAKTVPVTNGVLRSLSRAVSQRLLARCQQVNLTYGEVLAEFGDKIKHVYFVNSGIVSLLAPVDGHANVEVGLIGREGLVGISLLLGVGVSPVRVLVQGTGSAMRMDAAAFRAEVKRTPALAAGLNRYLYTFIAQVAQTAACNRHHILTARLARWLLMTHDRMSANEFYLTQAFLAHMLGVRRVGVSNAARLLQKRRLIRFRRGHITILNRRGLERASCRCYRTVNEIRDRMRA
ncbi:MAG: Crp/Fnr family transcriptional regulator [Gammaproteobacteria bacterium]